MKQESSAENQERRGRYRVSDVGRYGLTATLTVRETTIPVEIFDVAFAGADIATKHIDLKVGQPVTLQFSARGMANPAVVRATVRWRRHWGEDGNKRYGLLFQNPASLPRQIPTKLLGAFNRRRSFRVAPRGDDVIARITRQDGYEFSLPVISLSATGVGCLARDKSEEMLMTGDEVSMSFELPGSHAPCLFNATVQYALKQRGGVRYGLDFDETQTQEFLKGQRRITKYVMDEQRRMLKTV